MTAAGATSYFSSNVMPAFWASVSKHLSGRSAADLMVLDGDGELPVVLEEAFIGRYDAVCDL